MYQRYKERFGTAGVVLGVIAMILALGGTALAASKLTGPQKKEVEKIAKKYAGKPGAPGAAGTNGTNGTNGKDGVHGTNGKDGTNGTDGTDGTDGESVTVSSYTGPQCEAASGEAGAKFTNGTGTAYACNGVDGAGGSGGGGVLAPGEMETGVWQMKASGEETSTTILFPHPLSPSDVEEITFEAFNKDNTDGSEDCPGTAAQPAAEPGMLCVFVDATSGFGQPYEARKLSITGNEPGVSSAGAYLWSEFLSGEQTGTYAVTAPLAG